MTDITDVIKKVELGQGTSKSGTQYTYVQITLINDGEERIFLNSDSKFKWVNAVELLKD